MSITTYFVTKYLFSHCLVFLCTYVYKQLIAEYLFGLNFSLETATLDL